MKPCLAAVRHRCYTFNLDEPLRTTNRRPNQYLRNIRETLCKIAIHRVCIADVTKIHNHKVYIVQRSLTIGQQLADVFKQTVCLFQNITYINTMTVFVNARGS